MALTLKEAITATQTTLDVVGLDTLTNGDMYSIDDEYVLINTATVQSIQPGETAYQRVSLDRGVLGTAKAAHAAAATLTAVNIASAAAAAPLLLTGTDPTASVATITAATGQDSVADADLFVVAAPDDDKILVVRADGNVRINMAAHPGTPSTGLTVDGSGSANMLIVGDGNASIFSVSPSGAYLSGNRAADDVLYVEALTAQNAGVGLAIFVPQSGTNRVYITRGGYIKFKATAAPADAELSANEVAFWFDSTDGAAKLMFKGKQANGTVVTGNVALA